MFLRMAMASLTASSNACAFRPKRAQRVFLSSFLIRLVGQQTLRFSALLFPRLLST
jgi:hypothetical protein